MEKPYRDCKITDFMLQTRRTIPLSFDAPVIRSWRPAAAPILISSDDEDSVSPSYSASKVTLPSSSRDPKSKLFKLPIYNDL